MVIYRMVFKTFDNTGQLERILVMTNRCAYSNIYPLNISSVLCHSKTVLKIKVPHLW